MHRGGILRKTRRFNQQNLAEPREGEHIGVEPVLLALAMELAPGAWFVTLTAMTLKQPSRAT
jgi:hypothetical protein